MMQPEKGSCAVPSRGVLMLPGTGAIEVQARMQHGLLSRLTPATAPCPPRPTRYFQNQGTMLLSHHIGISRDSSQLPYLFVDGSMVTQIVRNANPYGHWLYNQETYYFLQAGNDCAASFGELHLS